MEHPLSNILIYTTNVLKSLLLIFPLGTVFLLVAVFSMSGLLSCCYHCKRIRSLRRRADLEAADNPASFKSTLNSNMSEKQNQRQSLSVVLMPGDQIPKFIALPCPCQPPRPEKVVEEVQLPPSPSSPKPIHMVVGLLL